MLAGVPLWKWVWEQGIGMEQTYFDPHVRVGETPAHVGHVAMVGAWRPDQVWVLPGALRVPWPQDGGAQAIAPWQRVEVVLDGVNLAVVWVAEVWGIWVLLGGLLAGQVLLGQLEAGLETLLGRVAMRDGRRQGGERGRHEKLWEEHLGDVVVLIACESMYGVGLGEGERENVWVCVPV